MKKMISTLLLITFSAFYANASDGFFGFLNESQKETQPKSTQESFYECKTEARRASRKLDEVKYEYMIQNADNEQSAEYKERMESEHQAFEQRLAASSAATDAYNKYIEDKKNNGASLQDLKNYCAQFKVEITE